MACVGVRFDFWNLYGDGDLYSALYQDKCMAQHLHLHVLLLDACVVHDYSSIFLF